MSWPRKPSDPTSHGPEKKRHQAQSAGRRCAGPPLCLVVSGANRHDVKLLDATLDGIVGQTAQTHGPQTAAFVRHEKKHANYLALTRCAAAIICFRMAESGMSLFADRLYWGLPEEETQGKRVEKRNTVDGDLQAPSWDLR